MPDDLPPLESIRDQVYDDVPEGSAGRNLENAMRAAMAQIKGMNFSRLARESGVSRGTFYLWFTNEQQPSTWTLGRVAKVLDVPVRDLWDAWEGREAVPPSTELAIHKLIERLDRQDARMAELVSRLDVLASGAIVAGVTRALNEGRGASSDTQPPPRQRRTRAPGG